jgi:uncharacterized membrane protein YuzA (DUF378 family)
MKTLNMIALTLLIIGGINWGLVGLFDFDLVAALFGSDTALANIVYVLVGVAAIYSLYLFKPLLRDGVHRDGHLAPR